MKIGLLRKNIFVIFCIVFVFLLMPNLIQNTVLAQSQPSVVAETSVELSKEAVILPQPTVFGEWQYKIDLYTELDTSKTNSLTENNFSYKFNQVGTFVLVYSLYKGYETMQLECILHVIDTAKPVISSNSRILSNYSINSQINVNYQVSDMSSYTSNLTVYLDGNKIHDKYTEPNLTLNKEGTYLLVYEATDASGNVAKNEYIIYVGNTNSNTLFIIFIIGGILLVAAGVVGLLIYKRRKTK